MWKAGTGGRMKLKALLHVHTEDDPKDRLGYSLFDVMDRCADAGFEVLALTCHETVVIRKDYEEYAHKKNILLIPGIEARIEGKDVLLLGISKDAEQIHTFQDLQQYKQDHPSILIIAAHPYLLFWRSLRNRIIRYADLFDAYEFHWFYSPFINFNSKTVRLAKKMGKPLVGTSDVHTLQHMFTTYSVIETPQKTIPSILSAIRSGKIMYKTEPSRLWRMIGYYISITSRYFRTRRKLS
jgi:predicted metal-dependent phosphoesterase TrpH